MNNYIDKLQKKQNLTSLEMEEVMRSIMSGKASQNDIALFLMALRDKGATVDEITGAAKIMRQFVVPVQSKHAVILDTCGTGGDRLRTFNISTIVAFVVAAAGVAVAKHGNRSVSSKCGSADLLEALGVNLDAESKNLSTCLDKIGIVFLFAQKLHPAMKHAAPARKQLGVETIFNVLGPLTNPAQATHQMMGVYQNDLTEPMAQVLKNLGLKKALVVHGADGLDEVTTTRETFVSEFNGKDISSYTIDPKECGIALASLENLRGGDASTNSRIALEILKGKKSAKRDIVVFNAACALYIAEKVKAIPDGIKIAEDMIDTGKALDKLEALKEFTHYAQ